MEETKKKISANDTIIKMLHHINSDKLDLFYQVGQEYYETLSRSGDISCRVKRLLAEKPKKLVSLSDLSGDLKKLIIQQPIDGSENVFLNKDVKSFIDSILLEWKHADAYKFHNLAIRNKILFHGITGNGKTTIARHVARMAELPFVEVNADMIIDGKLGNTNTNIHKVLSEITAPCVLFWDEVDSIGRIRGKGDSSAAGIENERMVNSILVNLEKLSSNVIFIGATNRKDVLDSAFLRRFDVQFEIKEPTDGEKLNFALQMFEYYKLPSEHLSLGVKESIMRCCSYNDIKLFLVDMARTHVLKKILTKTENHERN